MALRRVLTSGAVRRFAQTRTPAVASVQSSKRFISTVEDTRQIGDWPVVETKSAQVKDPFTFWDPQDRRNFGESLHEEDEYLSMWLVDETSANGRVEPKDQVIQLLMMFGLLGVVFLAVKNSKPDVKKPVHAKSFPEEYHVVPAAIDGTQLGQITH